MADGQQVPRIPSKQQIATRRIRPGDGGAAVKCRTSAAPAPNAAGAAGANLMRPIAPFSDNAELLLVHAGNPDLLGRKPKGRRHLSLAGYN